MILRALTNTRRKSGDTLWKAIALPVLMIIALLFLLCCAESARASEPFADIYSYYGVDEPEAEALRAELEKAEEGCFTVRYTFKQALIAERNDIANKAFTAAIYVFHYHGMVLQAVELFVKNHKGI